MDSLECRPDSSIKIALAFEANNSEFEFHSGHVFTHMKKILLESLQMNSNI